ncbi:uncharacterized protein SEPMUDRAFT_107479 [Sphaerulina musiva SO2202]|uniref:Uncharacterized protein n=1 Tax=Sphaerulina musiva (strain SO2202) TaxID=692275 RepID=M3D6H8_SPHMS|nr:uncharacterized protein SEPMUDRAFT_107479 [Sphaerulina musiva SO2202]EMF13469.1 hypothetical protein SEPMUDRAFT_107479 [Sphaerulina musiva SO2202]
MSHSTPPLTSTPSSSGTSQDSTVYENSTTTSTSSSSSFYEDDDEEDEEDEEDDEEEPFIILQATAIKITSFPPTAAGAVAKISMKGKGKGSGIATTTSQKVGRTPVRAPAVASRPPAFLATPGDALPVFSSERAKRAARCPGLEGYARSVTGAFFMVVIDDVSKGVALFFASSAAVQKFGLNLKCLEIA